MTKQIKSILSLGTVIIVAVIAMTSCEARKIEESTIFNNADDATVAKLTADGKLFTLNGLVDEFCKNEKGDYDLDGAGYRTRGHADGSDVWLFAINNIPEDTIGIYIRGRIVTDDYGGNYYKSLVIQQIVDGKQQALRISVDMSSVNGLYHQGQEILIRCNGLSIGRYANQPQLCVPTYNNNIYADKAAEKVGWAPGRIPSSRFANAVKLLGRPNKNKLYYEVMTMDELRSKYLRKYADASGKIDLVKVRELDGHLVRIKDVYFTGECTNSSVQKVPCGEWSPVNSNDSIGNPELSGEANVFGPTTGNVGNPQSRFVTADLGNTKKDTIKISTSEYAKYSHFYLPSTIDTATVTESGVTYIKHTFHYKRVRGTIQGVIGYYKDNARYDAEPADWAITPCGIDDYNMFETDDNGVVQNDESGNPIKWQQKEFSKTNYLVK
ncbi:MAG: hypothetical protein J6W92_03340 [Paludibacteraceae bacterium]|nr:hypothetical protein [Paludibacteraceae bacterium]